MNPELIGIIILAPILGILIYKNLFNSNNSTDSITNSITDSITDSEELSMIDIENEIKKNAREFSENRPKKTMEVLEVITKIKQGEKIVSLDLTDEECLILIWNRANHPLNKENCKKIKQAIFDNLMDCWEIDELNNIVNNLLGLNTPHYKIVCVTGRITRILSSLMLLDFDPKNWEVKKLEQFKNEIFEKVRIIIDEEAQNATLTPNFHMQNAGKTILAKTKAELDSIGEIGTAGIQLNNKIKESIINMINNFAKESENILSDNMIEGIKNEALVAIDML